MAYTKQNFADGNILFASEINAMETQIKKSADITDKLSTDFLSHVLGDKKYVAIKEEGVWKYIYPGDTVTQSAVLSGITEKTEVTDIVIGDGIKTIGEGAFFDGFSKVTSLIIGQGVESIESSAFASMFGDSLKVILPNALKTIGANAFNDGGVNEVVLGNNIENIDSYAFSWAIHNMTEIRLPNSIKTIGEDVFFNTMTPDDFGDYPSSTIKDIYVPWAESAVAGAPWGATDAVIHYNYQGGTV